MTSSDPFDLSDFEEPAPAHTPRTPAGEPAYLTGLNPEQRAAVEQLEGAVLVLAGAGTGKTRVLTTRIAHLLATGSAWPGQILAVTFTNKAAREMKDRIGGLIGGVVEGMRWLGTFHSLSGQILRRHAELVDLRSDFTIIDTDDQIRLIKQLLEAEKINDKRWPARAFAGLLDTWKNRGQRPSDLNKDEAYRFADGKAIELYEAYQARLKTLNACDFGDLLLECLKLLQSNEDILAEYRKRFKYLLVDEYQDTNVAQYLWLRLLAGQNGNICCVGDDDQSIYGWRGAEVDNILRFEKDFPGATVIRLERNYRSTANILGAASGLIKANEARLGKTLWTEAEKGDPLIVKGLADSEAEARFICEEIESLQHKGVRADEIAILVRASFQMREFEDRLMLLGIPYRVVGGPRFYEREEIRDAHAYLRLIHNPDNDLAFDRIVNKPARGIGKTTLQAINRVAGAQGVTRLRAATLLLQTDELKKNAASKLQAFLAMMARWREASESLPHTELAAIVLDESGYTEKLQNDKSPNAPTKLENLKELVQSMGSFGSLAEYLDHISLVMDLEQADADAKVNLMTLHAAKGLEFDQVFLPGWEEGLFPHQRSLDEGMRGLEEERRLAYVGITRAKVQAHVTFVTMRQTHGRWITGLPSRFLDELPSTHVDVRTTDEAYAGIGSESRFGASPRFSGSYDNPGWRRAQQRLAQGGSGNSAQPGLRRGPIVIDEAAELVATSDPEIVSFNPGERVFHQKFGYGLVLEIDGNKLLVDFEHAGRKKVIDEFLKRAAAV